MLFFSFLFILKSETIYTPQSSIFYDAIVLQHSIYKLYILYHKVAVKIILKAQSVLEKSSNLFYPQRLW